MYNRYIPQPDGSHSRRFMPDQAKRPQPHPAPPQSCEHPSDAPAQPHRYPSAQETSITGFLKKLLPADFDTGDLMIILLLLLMAGDCQEDQNWALLTLVLYLFL